MYKLSDFLAADFTREQCASPYRPIIAYSKIPMDLSLAQWHDAALSR